MPIASLSARDVWVLSWRVLFMSWVVPSLPEITDSLVLVRLFPLVDEIAWFWSYHGVQRSIPCGSASRVCSIPSGPTSCVACDCLLHVQWSRFLWFQTSSLWLPVCLWTLAPIFRPAASRADLLSSMASRVAWSSSCLPSQGGPSAPRPTSRAAPPFGPATWLPKSWNKVKCHI